MTEKQLRKEIETTCFAVLSGLDNFNDDTPDSINIAYYNEGVIWVEYEGCVAIDKNDGLSKKIGNVIQSVCHFNKIVFVDCTQDN